MLGEDQESLNSSRVGGLEHGFNFPQYKYMDVILPIDGHSIIFQRGRVQTTKQIIMITTIIHHY